MQRGWTLEEGSLAQTCVFQVMEEPYEMSKSLKNRVPQVKLHRSPLKRALINARRLMPLLLNRALSDEKRRLTIDPRYSRTLRLTKLLRVAQFVRIWNSLLERSTTETEDGPFIFANLLDFNVSRLNSIPQDERLKVLIQNCDELPLSLLYNTGPRIYDEEHPELGWIPKSIDGSHLVLGAVLRRINPKRKDQVKYEIDRSDSDPGSMMIWRIKALPVQSTPYDIEVFEESTKDGQKYFIEMQQSAIQMQGGGGVQLGTREAHTQASDTCMVIDLACGTASSRGFAGRGVCFHIDSCYGKEMSLKYDRPLIAWTAE